MRNPHSQEGMMCLAIPGQIKQIYDVHGARMGRVNFGGIEKEVCLAYMPDISVGDYTIVHVGFAITKINEEAAQQTLAMFRDLGLLDDEFGLNTKEEDRHEVPD
jgi:hydrogenase expression/formation protein HypC